MQSVQPAIAVERTVFYREGAAGMYSALPYALFAGVDRASVCASAELVYSTITRAMFSFHWTVEKFLWYLLFLYCTLLYFTYYGMMAVSLTPNHHISSIISTLFYGLWNIFSGFIIPRPKMPIWWRWYFWACPFSWSMYWLLVSQFGDLMNNMEGGETTAKQFLNDYFGYKHDFLGVVAAGVVGYTVLFAFIFGYAIGALNFQRR